MLEQHELKLQGFTYSWVFSDKYVLQYYTILNVTLYVDFQLLEGLPPLSPEFFNGQLSI